MRITILAALLAAAAPSHAQVFKCQQGGHTIYSDHPCAGATVLDEQQLRANALPRAPRPPAGRAETPVVEQHAPLASNCPTEQDITNMKTSASSRFLGRYERQLQNEDIARAEKCQPVRTASERAARLEEMKQASAAAAAAAANSGPKTCFSYGGGFSVCN